MAFHFPLEAVLRLRQSQERAERLKLETITSEQAHVRARIQEMMDNSFKLHRHFQHLLGSGMAGSELGLELVRETKVNSVRDVLRTRLVELERRRGKQVQIFFQVRRNCEVLENLRNRRFNLYRTQQGRREQQELDDVFLMMQANKNGE